MTANRCREALAALLALGLSTGAAVAATEVTRTSSPVRVDGVLEETAWEGATAIELPYEWFPGDNVPAPVKTTALVTVDLPQTRLFYHFSRRSFLRAIFQYEWLRREPDLYTAEVDRESKELLTQLLFSYRLNAQTVFLVGYSDNHLGIDAVDLTQTDRTVFLKLGYAFLR